MGVEETQAIWGVVKIGFIVVLIVYTLFAFVVMRQVKSMTSTLTVGFEGILNLMAFVHVLVSVGVTIAAVIYL